MPGECTARPPPNCRSGEPPGEACVRRSAARRCSRHRRGGAPRRGHGRPPRPGCRRSATVSRSSSSIFSVASAVQPRSSWRLAIARWTCGSPGAVVRSWRQTSSAASSRPASRWTIAAISIWSRAVATSPSAMSAAASASSVSGSGGGPSERRRRRRRQVHRGGQLVPPSGVRPDRPARSCRPTSAGSRARRSSPRAPAEAASMPRCRNVIRGRVVCGLVACRRLAQRFEALEVPPPPAHRAPGPASSSSCGLHSGVRRPRSRHRTPAPARHRGPPSAAAGAGTRSAAWAAAAVSRSASASRAAEGSRSAARRAASAASAERPATSRTKARRSKSAAAPERKPRSSRAWRGRAAPPHRRARCRSARSNAAAASAQRSMRCSTVPWLAIGRARSGTRSAASA